MAMLPCKLPLVVVIVAQWQLYSK